MKRQDLGNEVADIGLLIGLLTGDADALSFNPAWFENPIAEDQPSLRNIGKRMDHLVDLIRSLLGQGVPQSLDKFPDAQWYPIPDPSTGGSTVFHIVAPQAAPSGQLGCGVRHEIALSHVKIDLYAYVPLLSYSPTDGTDLIMVSPDHPCQIGLTVAPSGKDPFKVGDASFSALRLSADIYLSPSAYEPTPPDLCTVEFCDLTVGGTARSGTYSSLSDLRKDHGELWIGEVVAQGSDWLDLNIGDSWVTPGDILVAGNFLSRDDDGAYQFNPDTLTGQKPLDLVLNFIFGALDALSDSDIPVPVIELSGGGLYCVRRELDGGATDYGLSLALDIPLAPGTNEGETGKAASAVTLSLGTWLTGEDNSNNWIKRSSEKAGLVPGVAIFALRRDANNALSFAPGFSLASVGINIEGGNNTPLVSLDGYTLNGAELRSYLEYLGPSAWDFGFAGKLDGLGFPLGPGFGDGKQGSKSNPVAQSLLASGSDGDGAEPAEGEAKPADDPVNPALSLSAAYVLGGKFAVQLYDKDDKPAEVVVIPIQRAVGPLHVEKLGIGWVQDSEDPAKNNMLSLLFDGGVALAGLEVDLTGLSIGVPVTTPGDFSRYDIDLQGIGMTLEAGEVELSAALVKKPGDPTADPSSSARYTRYDGEALLKAGAFAISAIGSYAYVPLPGYDQGYASLFIFGIFDGELGGPGFFYVTGLAAGFGYNRRLILPEQDGVATYPLVAAASEPDKLGGAPPDPAKALALFDKFVPPERGEYWLAAGVRFTSFDLINSTALLTVEFGNELEIALLGRSWISLPPPAAPGASAPAERYAYAELGIMVKLLPREGVFSATAILTPNSFVLDPACKLTGGFAFYAWFGDNPHAGDFVLTLGGYHPQFKPPSYYPTVPRLGFHWPVDSEVTIDGEAYFALTPSAVMAGAGLQILFSRGDLHAWFKAQMDALIAWAPFHYSVGISVSLGVSYRLKISSVAITLRAELGGDLQLSGPPMAGVAHINWYVISFTVAFGASQQGAPSPLKWTDDNGTGFAQTLLPHRTTEKPAALQRMALAAGAVMGEAAPEKGSVEPGGVYTITVNDGLLRSFTRDGQTIWVVRPNHFVFSAVTTIPATEVDVAGAKDGKPTLTTLTPQDKCPRPAGTDYFVCIRPMKATLSKSAFTVKMQQAGDSELFDLDGHFDYAASCQSVPAAKWGKPLGDHKDPEPNELLPGRLMGLQKITPKPPKLSPLAADGSAALDIAIKSAYTCDVVDDPGNVAPGEAPHTPDHLPLKTGAQPSGGTPQVDKAALNTIQGSLMQDKVVSARNDIYAALQDYGVGAVTNSTLHELAGNPGAYLAGNPLVAAGKVTGAESNAEGHGSGHGESARI